MPTQLSHGDNYVELTGLTDTNSSTPVYTATVTVQFTDTQGTPIAGLPGSWPAPATFLPSDTNNPQLGGVYRLLLPITAVEALLRRKEYIIDAYANAGSGLRRHFTLSVVR